MKEWIYNGDHHADSLEIVHHHQNPVMKHLKNIRLSEALPGVFL